MGGSIADPGFQIRVSLGRAGNGTTSGPDHFGCGADSLRQGEPQTTVRERGLQPQVIEQRGERLGLAGQQLHANPGLELRTAETADATHGTEYRLIQWQTAPVCGHFSAAPPPRLLATIGCLPRGFANPTPLIHERARVAGKQVATGAAPGLASP